MIVAQNLLNQLVHHLDLRSFCEIGYANGNTQHAVSLPIADKVGIDPYPDTSSCFIQEQTSDDDTRVFKCDHNLLVMTSDKFFETNEKVYDLFLIDGDHNYQQVYRDIINSLKFLSPNGVIVCHDAAPLTREQTLSTTGGSGDAYKALMRLRGEKNDLSVYCLNEYNTPPPDDNGIGIIYKDRQEDWKESFNVEDPDFDSWKYLKDNKSLMTFCPFKTVLNLIKERNKKL
mgnify:CR=1 FL=1|tara:strand:+ start:3336 stop:4025 length:690 start_codon:yes stop_codon:yes gene_type:complete